MSENRTSPFPRISEAEFERHLQGKLQALADMVNSSGCTRAEIARATRTKWDTVAKVSRGIPVRYDNACRIECFLNRNQQNNKQ